MATTRTDPVKKRLWLGLLVTLFMLVTTAVVIYALGGGRSYEEPDYELIEKLGTIEIREYAPYLVAETTVNGDAESAGNEGFRILAGYIFGDNQGEKKIAMTAPVNQERDTGSKIAMTAPVTQERAGGQFKIRFMMPSEYTMETLPKPNDTRITIRQVPASKFAAIRYSGTWSQKNYDKHWSELQGALADNGYRPTGEPTWARYDPPFMPWFLRRNEILTAFE